MIPGDISRCTGVISSTGKSCIHRMICARYRQIELDRKNNHTCPIPVPVTDPPITNETAKCSILIPYTP